MLKVNLELLAPAGKWDVIESVAAAGADAVYLGGIKFNMRMVRSGFNFSNQELERATQFLHEQNKKIYITVNNLYFGHELEELKEYLLFLNSIHVDALIVQDMAIAQICKEMNIDTPLHASVQMGIANLASVKYLEEQGFERVVLSKNLTLKEITRIHESSNLGLEFFAHGELCVAHTGHCYMSQLLFGESGNRGSCKKTCRWKYQLHLPGDKDDVFKNYLANGDLCVYPYLAEMAQAGVTSFKIEGRMKNADYLIPLIEQYRKAMDRLMEKPLDYQTDMAEMNELIAARARDYTPGHFWGRPALDSIGLTGEREPRFDTAPVKLGQLCEDNYMDAEPPVIKSKPELTVKVANIKALQRLQGYNVGNVILSMEMCRQEGSKWVPELIDDAVQLAHRYKQKVYLETPGVMTESDWHIFNKYGINRIQKFDGIIVNDYGSLQFLQSFLPDQEFWAGAGLNITNSEALKSIQARGIKRLVMPYELEISKLNGMTDLAEIQIMVQGPICGMVTDLCLAGSVKNRDKTCSGFCTGGEYVLVDEYGQNYHLKTDINCRNYLYYPYELCLFTHLPTLAGMGIKSFAIEGQYYNPDLLEEIVSIYSNALWNIQNGEWQQHENYQRLLHLIPEGLTDRPFVTCTQLK